MSQTELAKVGVVVLAAGMGKRMKSTKLKVMHELNGRPMIDYVVSAVEKANFGTKPVVVVCADDPAVQNYLGPRAEYVVQAERLGTGHAVQMAKESLLGRVQNVIVLYGDMPFITADSLKKLIERHEERGNTLTMMTVIVPDFVDWRVGLYDYGRVVRGANGHILRTVEKKDASPQELEIKELNPCYCCFKSEWLWENLAKLRNSNAQKEYYLTDLVRFAVEQGEKISAIDINPKEAIGVNTLEQLQNAESIK